MSSRRPNFLILGAPKCGTTSLCYYLAQHPDVFVPRQKEPRFFDAEYEKGLDYYWQTYFSDWAGELAVGEGRVFLLFLPFVPARIRESLPDARLIAILRDPVDRAYSHWWHRYTARNESLPFEDAIEQNLERIASGVDFGGDDGPELWRKGLLHETAMASRYRTYLECGLYAGQLRRYFELFPREQLRIADYDEFVRDPRALVRELWAFLGVDPDPELVDVAPQNQARAALESRARQRVARFLVATGLRRLIPRRIRQSVGARWQGPAAERPPLAPETRARLAGFYRQPNRDLEALLGRRFTAWTH